MKKWIVTGSVVVLAISLWAQAPKGTGGGVSARYIDNNDGTVTDTATGLMWTKNADHGRMSWSNAAAYCDNLITNGYSDWRLPTVAKYGGAAELDKLLREGENPSGAWGGVKGTPFTGVQNNFFYWSGTSSTNNTDNAWLVPMGNGYVYYSNKTSSNYVWPVRGRQQED